MPIKIALPNTAYITNTYDNVARMLGTYLKSNNGVVLDAMEYGYNTDNQRTTSTNAGGAYVNYTYDNIGQLKVADSVTNSEDRGYFYDAAWNLNYRTNNGSLQDFYVDNKNQLTNALTWDNWYDGNGNMTTNGYIYFKFEYDDENQLAAAEFIEDTREEFVYDGKGRLKQHTELVWNGEGWDPIAAWNYIYDGMLMIQERTDNTPTVSYTRGIDLSGSMEGAGGIGDQNCTRQPLHG